MFDKTLSVLYFNSQSLNKDKLEDLDDYLERNNHDIIAVTETWWNDDSHKNLEGYKAFYNNRETDLKDSKTKGGGTAIYVKEELQPKSIQRYNYPGLEIISLLVKTLNIICVYLSPSASSKTEDNLLQYLKNISGNFLIVGDFNYPGIKWIHKSYHKFFQFISRNNLWQSNHFPTRKDKILDLIITKRNSFIVKNIKKIEFSNFPVKTDHNPLVFDVKI